MKLFAIVLTLLLPVLAQKIDTNQIRTSAKQGTGTKLQTATGTFNVGHTLAYDASGAAIDSGSSPGVGGSGGSGPSIFPYGTPPSTGWSWDNQFGATETVAVNGARAVEQTNFDPHVNSRFRSLPATSGYTVTMGLTCERNNINNTNDLRCFIGLGDGTKWQTFYFSTGSNAASVWFGENWNSSTSSNALISSAYFTTGTLNLIPLWAPNIVFLKVVDDGTNITIYQSNDNILFSNRVFQQSRTAFLPAGASVIGWGALNNLSGGGAAVGSGLMSYQSCTGASCTPLPASGGPTTGVGLFSALPTATPGAFYATTDAPYQFIGTGTSFTPFLNGVVVTPPALVGQTFTKLFDGTGTATFSSVHGALVVTAPAHSPDFVYVGINLPASSNYTVTAGISCTTILSNYNSCGVFVGDSSGTAEVFLIEANGTSALLDQVSENTWNTFVSSNGANNGFMGTTQWARNPAYLRIVNSGGTRSYQVSNDGKLNWVTWVSNSRGFTDSKVGLVLQTGPGGPTIGTLFDITITTP